MRINFDFTDLEAFLAVLDTGSFHGACDTLDLSQSAVTRRIKKLETALGTQLFHRTTRDVKPTLAAKRLRIRAEAILSETRETARAMQDSSARFAHQLTQTVAVAAIPTVIPGILAPALASLSRTRPGLRIRVIDAAANEVGEAVSNGDADLGLCSAPAFEPDTRFEFLFDDPIVLALHRDHRLAERKCLKWKDLQGEALILPNRDTGNRTLIDDALARTGTPLAWSLEVARTNTALDCASAGLGIAPVPRSAIPSEPGVLAGRHVTAPDIARPVGLLTKVRATENPLGNVVADAIRTVVRNRGQQSDSSAPVSS